MIIDTHCHLNDERLIDDTRRIVDEFLPNGIESAICVGYDMPSSECAVELADKFDGIYAAVGIHPHDAKLADNVAYDRLSALSSHKKTVAIGEIGLDYYYDLSPRDVQQRAFCEQIELADTLGLPIALHVRDAYEDARKILFDCKRYINNGLLLHCYSGSAEYVKVFGKLDAYFAFGGAITFKNAKHNLEALAAVPRDRVMFETDCPYMTPVPYRGKTNEPKFINYVIDKAAQVLETDRQTLIDLSTNNAKRLFTKIK